MKKVILVDDDGVFLEEVTEILRLSGYEISSFLDGADALKHVRKEIPHAVLVDLKMSPVSGFQLAMELKKYPETKHIPLIGVTGVYTENEHNELMRICGIEKCLTKPVQPLELISALEEATTDKLL